MTSSIAAAILAGGDGQRLGGTNKAAVVLRGHTLLDRIYARLNPQADPIALCVRSSGSWPIETTLPLLEDCPGPDCGPLGGIAAALAWAQHLSSIPEWVITVPVDTPFLPNDLCARLTASAADVAIAESKGQAHHTVAAWRPHLATTLLDYLSDGAKPVRAFQQSLTCTSVTWGTADGDPFMNINTPEDVALAAERVIS